MPLFGIVEISVWFTLLVFTLLSLVSRRPNKLLKALWSLSGDSNVVGLSRLLSGALLPFYAFQFDDK